MATVDAMSLAPASARGPEEPLQHGVDAGGDPRGHVLAGRGLEAPPDGDAALEVERAQGPAETGSEARRDLATAPLGLRRVAGRAAPAEEAHVGIHVRGGERHGVERDGPATLHLR